MVLLDTLVNYTNEALAIDTYSDYCPNGLQVEGKKQVKKLAIAVTASLHVIKKAIKAKADALLVHHGFFWGSTPQTLTGVYKEKIQLLLQHKLSLLTYHLPLDGHEQWGNNWGAFIEMGIDKLQPFGYFSGKAIGVQGSCKKISASSLLQKLSRFYGQKPQLVQGGPKKIQSLGLISGGAHREIKQAIDLGLDAYLTGTCDEPLWHLSHEEGIHFYALGHHASEKVGPRRLGKHLCENFKLSMVFIDEPNPF